MSSSEGGERADRAADFSAEEVSRMSYEEFVKKTRTGFYVDEGCTLCAAPEWEAPDLIGYYLPIGDEHPVSCYFKKQPRSHTELERAMNAMAASCVECLRYRGEDESINELLRGRGLGHLIDDL